MNVLHWITTSEGRQVPLEAPLDAPGALTIAAIAHSLACVNRFTGHALRPYSVAEHSLLVCDIVEGTLHMGVHAQLAALMHDAHESVTNDLATPAKAVVGPGWAAFEGEWEHALHTLFALRSAFALYRAAIKQADLIALATEWRDLMHPSAPRPSVLAGIEPLASVNLRHRDSFTWADWRQAFEDRYLELDFARNRLHDMHHDRSPA